MLREFSGSMKRLIEKISTGGRQTNVLFTVNASLRC